MSPSQGSRPEAATPRIPNVAELTPEQREAFVRLASKTGVVLAASDVYRRLPAEFLDALAANGITVRSHPAVPPGVLCAFQPQDPASLFRAPSDDEQDDALQRFAPFKVSESPKGGETI